MSTLQVANIHLESTGNNRIQYDGSNTFTIAAGDANVAVVNSTSISINTDVDIADKIVHSGDTDTSIRFPAADTVTVETAGAERVRIDASGNVGIGTSNPVTILDIIGTSPILHRYTGSANAFLFGQYNPGGDANINNQANASLLLATNNTERMRIDSAGNVTKPYQPMFLGYPTNDYSGGSMPTGVMSVTAYYNNGGHFNVANSRFTAPVAGWYLTTWGGLQLTNTVTSLMINGARQHNGNHGVYTGSYITMTQTAIVSLNAGDYLNIEQWNGGGYYSGWYLWSVTLLG